MNEYTVAAAVIIGLALMACTNIYTDAIKEVEMAKMGLQQCETSSNQIVWQKECLK